MRRFYKHTLCILEQLSTHESAFAPRAVKDVEELAANLERCAFMDGEFLEERSIGKRMHDCPDGLHAYAESVKSEAGSLLEGRY
jgi:hypothetical protein